MNVEELKDKFLKEHKGKIKIDEKNQIVVEEDRLGFLNYIIAILVKENDDLRQTITNSKIVGYTKLMESIEKRIKWLEEKEGERQNVLRRTQNQVGSNQVS